MEKNGVKEEERAEEEKGNEEEGRTQRKNKAMLLYLNGLFEVKNASTFSVRSLF